LPKEAQKLITTTHLGWWEQDGASLPVSEVSAGVVTPCEGS
jgi:hypothetical protein